MKALNTQAFQRYQAGDYAAAISIAERALALAERVPEPPHPELGAALENLAEIYRAQGRAAEAEPLTKRALSFYEKAVGPDHPFVATSLNNLAASYLLQGRYVDAEPLYQRALELRMKALGADHPHIATSLNNLAELYRAQSRYAEAESFYQRSLATWEKVAGPDHPQTGSTLHNFAELLQAQGRYVEAEPLYKRSLVILEKALGPDHPNVGAALNNLARLYREQGRYSDALPLFERTLTLYRTRFGPNHPWVAVALNNLAETHLNRGQLSEAEVLYEDAVATIEKAQGPDHPNAAILRANLAGLYERRGKRAEAETLMKRSLGVMEKTLGTDHPDLAAVIGNLAGIYERAGRYTEAELLGLRALAIHEKVLGPDHSYVANSLEKLAGLYWGQRRFEEAEEHYKRSLTIKEKALGPDHPHVGSSLDQLAGLYQALKRFADAEPLYSRSFDIAEKALGLDHPFVGVSLNNLAGLFADQERHTEAETAYMRALAIAEKTQGSEHPDVGLTLHNLAALHFAQGQWTKAADYWRRSTQLVVRSAKRGTESTAAGLSGKSASRPEHETHRFYGLIKAAYRIEGAPGAAWEAFTSAQRAQGSQAAAALAQMAARQARGDDALASLLRERQDLVGEWQARDKVLIAAIAQLPDKRNAAAEQAQRVRLSAIDARIIDIDTRLAGTFPDYAAFASPEPLSVPDVQAQLRIDEALVLFLDTTELKPTPEETFLWVVTKTDARSVRSELGTRALSESVAALRCGLDQVAWDDDRATRCGNLLKGAYAADDAKAGKPLPFDLDRAHQLYRGLFSQVEDLISGKNLLIVPSGPLTAIPFQALITDKPAAAIPVDAAGYASAAWLAKRHAVTVLPSVASLKALRQFAKASKATQPFIGFGNPLLTGPSGTDKRAWERQSCASPSTSVQVARRGVSGPIPKFFRTGLANLEEVRTQYPLPETADELCAVARSNGAADSAVYLGDKASESTIKALSANGRLAQSRVVHFATHGLLAGETEMLIATKAEPSLILTPPETATEEDDGLLTASEIAQLKLDADWVVLSACNTAAGESDKPGAEALSGLARAFLYAGARALLVSHWAVNSVATVKLITRTFDELKANSKVGRAEALRRSMLALVATDDYAHPAFWAPFVVVGEGAN